MVGKFEKGVSHAEEVLGRRETTADNSAHALGIVAKTAVAVTVVGVALGVAEKSPKKVLTRVIAGVAVAGGATFLKRAMETRANISTNKLIAVEDMTEREDANLARQKSEPRTR